MLHQERKKEKELEKRVRSIHMNQKESNFLNERLNMNKRNDFIRIIRLHGPKEPYPKRIRRGILNILF